MSKKYTKQEAFDKSISGLRNQGKKSHINNGRTCAYRGDDNCKCGIGHLILNKDYHKNMEGTVIGGLFSTHKLENLRNLDGVFLYQLQKIHDLYSTDEWPKEAFIFAINFNLQFKHLISVVCAFGRTYYSWKK